MTHPCDVNFFQGAIRRWRDDGHDVELLVLDRGVVPRLVRHEYPDVPARRVGTHANGRWGLYLQSGLLREVQLLAALRGRRLDAVVGFPGFQTAMVAKVLGIKSLGAYDDPEHKPNMRLARLFCDRLILPECLGIRGRNIVLCRALKEWAYLSPRAFAPNPEVLKRYGLVEREYYLIREVAPRSLNYRPEPAGTEASSLVETGASRVEALYRRGMNSTQVLLSLEDKSRSSSFSDWEVLQEPVEDLHSLMYYARAVASNGDSMAREAAQLGVPSVYLGDRFMKANDCLVDLGILQHLPDVTAAFEFLSNDPAATEHTEAQQAAVRERLTALWDDPTDVLTDTLYQLLS